MTVITDFHPQVRIAWGGIEAEVDAGLAATILALWREGFETFSSCEGQGHMTDWYETAYIVFARNYLGQTWEIRDVIAGQGWVVLDIAAWESPDPRVPTRTVARFVRPGTTI